MNRDRGIGAIIIVIGLNLVTGTCDAGPWELHPLQAVRDPLRSPIHAGPIQSQPIEQEPIQIVPMGPIEQGPGVVPPPPSTTPQLVPCHKWVKPFVCGDPPPPRPLTPYPIGH
jgi:hypothetical protein